MSGVLGCIPLLRINHHARRCGEWNRDAGYSEACVCAHRLHIKKEGHATQAKLSDYRRGGTRTDGPQAQLSGRNYQQSPEPQRIWKNKTVLRYLRGGQILALMSDHWAIHKLSLNSSEKKRNGHLYAQSLRLQPALLLLLRFFRLDGTGTFIEMDVRRKQNMPGLTIMTFFSLSMVLLRSIWKIVAEMPSNSQQTNSLSLLLAPLC